MEEYNQELTDLKELVGKALDKKGTLAKIRAQLRASIFEVIEDQDNASGDAGSKSVIGSCSERAKAYHSTKNGQVLVALLCEYFEWCELEHTSRMYHVEGNLRSEPRSRAKLEEDLGLPVQKETSSPSGPSTPSKSNEPVLAKLLDAYLSGKAKPSSSTSQSPTTGKPSSSSAKNARSNSPTVRRESMGATIMRSISPARGHRMGLKSLIPGSKNQQNQ